MKNLTKYLSKYAEMETRLLLSFPDNFLFKHCIVIPACDEHHNFIERLSTSSLCDGTLLILVLNQASNASEKIHSANLALANYIQVSKVLWRNQHLSLFKCNELHVLLVDRFSTGFEIPSEEGVGRARKLGCDLAVALFANNCISSPWIYSTDADASLPENYFSADCSAASALVFDFHHEGEAGAVLEATLLYERALKYYRAALAWAGSPYAFYTLGSTLAVHTEAYCKVRGFPARAGAEDFYLLNKLAKVGDVRFVEDVCIQLEARRSDRVPFGTGPAVQKILDCFECGEPWRYYHPAIFLELRTLLRSLDQVWAHIFEQADLETALGNCGYQALNNLKLARFSDHCRKQNIPRERFENEFHLWFDAFQTLKFVHFLQNSVYPALDLEKCEQLFEGYPQQDADLP